ncbi:MAG: molecular chaperone DnaJ [Treponema sp. GWB1_62_6]|nr:MAG: molecular chaperone DnaJ [Treponema sp. GWA1_62_8]OHE67303.1 MAG: molecular chaperone DnaJ [Treponema sp. GWB1_62_6]OHE67698.1 MAG: molecular chaperone DnaJ [Treponema sp. GWC1_61_84]OHE76849.1 MAG: molecular chaperone DnaJ [Treponema sp. RIFOXYC1_FULL_61_9]HCM29051.1 molecular chaperone DnaJ [Treponema sp.]
MENYYGILGVDADASSSDIKRAFREQAKRVHPDIAGDEAHAAMRRLLTAYETLSDIDRRQEYDRAYFRFVRSDPRWKEGSFDYRSFLKEKGNDPASQAKLLFFDLLHLEEDEALDIWRRNGGLGFRLDEYLDREDWMDCSFILAEELDSRGESYEAFRILLELIAEERKRPYFRHFMGEVDALVKEIARVRLASRTGDDLLVECLEGLLDMGYSRKEEARWLRTIAEALERLGDGLGAAVALRRAIRLDPSLPNVVQLKRRLGIQEKTI